MRNRFLSLTLAAAVASTMASAQELTLRERAALVEDELNVGLGYDGNSPELSVLAKEADLIVHGRIVTSRSYLSDDGMLIYSDYPVQVRRVMAGSLPSVARTATQTELNVTHEGGELQLDGKRVRVSNMLLPRLPVGSDVILFLRRSPDGQYEVVRQGYGAFAINGGTVSALSRRGGPHHEFDGRPVAAFDRAIQSWRAGSDPRVVPPGSVRRGTTRRPS